VKYLLDTHCWLWLQVEPERIAARTLDALADSRNEIFLSAASSWEIAIKYSLGKLLLPQPPREYVASRMQRSGTSGLPIQHAHTVQVAELPHHHNDPFDRLLVAQAQCEGLVMVTADERFKAYDVEISFA